MVDQRYALLERSGVGNAPSNSAMTPLIEPPRSTANGWQRYAVMTRSFRSYRRLKAHRDGFLENIFNSVQN